MMLGKVSFAVVALLVTNTVDGQRNTFNNDRDPLEFRLQAVNVSSAK